MLQLNAPLKSLLAHRWPLVGVVHLAALPGTPFCNLSLSEIQDRAEADLEALVLGGVEGVIVENFGDIPFRSEHVEPHIVAAMTRLVLHLLWVSERLRSKLSPALGVNVLRNDAIAAVAVAAMSGAHFVRVNVHSGAMVTDQWIVQGRAYDTLCYRRSLEADVAIFADVLVKHASTIGEPDLLSVASDTFYRGGADVLIVSGHGTGLPTSRDDLERIRRGLDDAPVLIGSGLTVESLKEVMPWCNGAIVGTSLKVGGDVNSPVDRQRVIDLVETRNSML